MCILNGNKCILFLFFGHKFLTPKQTSSTSAKHIFTNSPPTKNLTFSFYFYLNMFFTCVINVSFRSFLPGPSLILLCFASLASYMMLHIMRSSLAFAQSLLSFSFAAWCIAHFSQFVNKLFLFLVLRFQIINIF